MFESGWKALASRTEGLSELEGREDRTGCTFEWFGTNPSWGTKSAKLTKALNDEKARNDSDDSQSSNQEYGRCPDYKVDWNEAICRTIIDALVMEAEDRNCSTALPAAAYEEDIEEVGPIDGDIAETDGGIPISAVPREVEEADAELLDELRLQGWPTDERDRRAAWLA